MEPFHEWGLTLLQHNRGPQPVIVRVLQPDGSTVTERVSNPIILGGGAQQQGIAIEIEDAWLMTLRPVPGMNGPGRHGDWFRGIFCLGGWPQWTRKGVEAWPLTGTPSVMAAIGMTLAW